MSEHRVKLRERGYRFRLGAVRYSDLCYLAAADPDATSAALPHTVFFSYDRGTWGVAPPSSWNAISMCVVRQPTERMIAIGEHGNVRVIGGGEDSEHTIADTPDGPRRVGPLREVRAIAQEAYACGMGRQVYRRSEAGPWVRIDQDIGTAAAADAVFGFESIHGFDAGDLYAVGWHGEIWHFDGTTWHRVDSPTSLLLTRVLCAPDGWAYACGARGVLLRGRGDTWTILSSAAPTADLHDLEWWGDHLIASSTRALYRWTGSNLEVLSTGDLVAATCHQLDAADGILWSVGETDILQLDAERWTRIE
jgi:hypothetical protein